MAVFDDRPYSCRLHSNEREYLNRSDFSTFADYVHYSIKRDIISEKKITKQDSIRTHSKNIIFIGIGAWFIFYSFSGLVLFAFLISFLLGVFFLTTGLLDVLMEILKKIKVEREVGRTETK